MDGLVFPAGAEGGPFGRRQRHARAGRVPVILVTGFLGAGKTTLVKALLDSPEGAGTVVVVNEFGDIGIDQALLAPSAESRVALLGNGCVCCAARSDLEQTFRTLLTDRARGLIPPFQRVVLELSGADDPTTVLQTFLNMRALGREYHLQAVVAVVDAATGALALADNPEARRQIALADRMVLTKADLASEAEIAALTAVLRDLNPAAPLLTAQHGRIGPDLLLADSDLALPNLLVAEVVHRPDLATFTLDLDRPISWTGLTAALGLLCELRGADLLRIKGLVRLDGCQGPVVIHAVRHLLHKPVELAAWPVGAASRLVFITQGRITRDQVSALFAVVGELTG